MSIQTAFPGVVLPSLTPATSSRRRLMVRAKGALLIIETQWEHLLCPCRRYDDKAAEVAQGFWKKPGEK